MISSFCDLLFITTFVYFRTILSKHGRIISAILGLRVPFEEVPTQSRCTHTSEFNHKVILTAPDVKL